MSGTYVPGFSPSLERFAIGGGVDTGQDYAPLPTSPQRQSTKPELAANLTALLAAQQAGQNPQMDPVEAALVAGMQQPTYSPEFQGYLNSVNDYMSTLGNPDVGQFYRGIPLGRDIAGPAGGIKVWNPEASIASYATKPVEQNVGYYASLYDGSGGLLGSGPAGAVNVQYNTPIVLVNNRTGEIVAQGTGLKSAQDIVNQAKALSASDAGKADWSVFTGEPGATDPSTYKRVMYDTPNRSALGLVADIALPALGAVALGPLGAALGSGLSGTAQGRSLGNILKGAALSGALTAGFGQIMGPLGAGTSGAASGATSGVASGAASGLASGAASGLAAAIPGQIVVEGIKSGIAPALVGALSGAAAGIGSGLLSGSTNITNKLPQLRGNNPSAPYDPNAPITVSGVRPPAPPLPTTPGLPSFPNIGITDPGLATNMGGIKQPTPQPETQQPTNETVASPDDTIVVRRMLDQGLTAAQLAAYGVPAAVIAAAAALPGSAGAGATASAQQPVSQQPNPSVPETVGANPITVTANPGALTPAQVAAAAALGAGGLGAVATSPNAPVSQPTTPGKSILDQIGDLSTLDKIRLAGLGLGTIGDLFGGGGAQSTGTIPAGLGGPLNAVFNKALPAANLPTAAPRAAQDIDYYRYGYGPQQSFFNNAPQGAANTSTAYTGYAEGGEVRDYDMEGALRAGIKPDDFGHMPDTYKLPNHMTFSEDSVYSTPEHRGGRWVQGNDGHWVFWPSEHNMREHPMPEMQDYFERVEQGVPGRPDSYAVYPSDYRLPERKAAGGSTFAVGGPGDGREDKIPAMLSDGEYVIDAETVAMLGNGSSKAGAKKLDQFRVNVRKQKGRKMAKGQFSDDAKAPEHYLKGRN